MKIIRSLLIAIAAMTTFQAATAQAGKSERSIKTESIKVYGNCGMDKKRIEKAAYSANGVKSAVWNEDTHILILKYSVNSKNAGDNAQKKIASVGNDTEKYRADDAVYQSLPDCCHYERKKS